MMTLGLELPIFFRNKETEEADTIGKTISYQYYDQKVAVFWEISCISPYIDEDDPNKPEYTNIHSGGGVFCCAYSVEETQQVIDTHLALINLKIINQ